MHPSAWIIVDSLMPIILKNVPGDILEIGMGGSTIVLSKHAKEFDRRFISCDVDAQKCSKWRHEVYNVTSEIFFSMNKLSNLAVSFIDGDHRINAARIDIDNSLRHLSLGGVIFIHDTTLYHRSHCDQYKYIKELEDRSDLQVFTWPYTASNCGLTMIMKKDFKPFLRR